MAPVAPVTPGVIQGLFLALLAAWGTSTLADAAPHQKLTVFAAASLTEAFKSIGTAFEKAQRVSVEFSFAGSSTLVTQIKEGAPADVFASGASGC